MNPNLKRTLLTAALASAALASPAWAQVTTNTTANTPGANADAGAQTRLRAECYDETTRTLRTTANCTGLTVDGSGMISGSANSALTPPPAGSASAPAPYPSAPKATASTQTPKSLKEQSSGSSSTSSGTDNSTSSSSSSSMGR
jgi:hypothetical protein